MEEDNRNASIGFHTFIGCECASSSWKTMNSKSSSKEAMPRFGENDSVDDHLCRTLGELQATLKLHILRANRVAYLM